MYTPELFVTLPEYVCTPDGMDIDPAGNLILSCPNYADPALSGCVVRIRPDRTVAKWFDAPVHPETGVARNMGIALGPDGAVYLCDNQGWSGDPALADKGRILKVTVDEAGNIARCVTVADGMEHPNGIRIRDGYMYVTQSSLARARHPSGRLVSCVYRFALDDEGVQVTNTLQDPNIIATFVTRNPEVQYGADGIVFNHKGELLVGNFGDGEVYKITFDERGNVLSNQPFARDPEQLQSTDGMIVDEQDNLYIADFSANAICRVTPEGAVARIAQSPDCDGLDGGLDQPGEPIIWRGMLIASCFDLVTGPDKVNTAHEMPATMSCFAL